MYQSQLSRMQEAVKAQRVRFTTHCLDELADEGYLKADVYHCIMTGVIVDDQYDLRYLQTKYIVFGDACNQDEIGLIVRFDEASGIVIITAFQLQVDDYE